MSFTIHKILANIPDLEKPFTGVTESLWTAHGGRERGGRPIMARAAETASQRRSR
jgi:hypothetical protein